MLPTNNCDCFKSSDPKINKTHFCFAQRQTVINPLNKYTYNIHKTLHFSHQQYPILTPSMTNRYFRRINLHTILYYTPS